MRVVSVGAPLVLVWLCGCGDADRSSIDLGYRNRLSESPEGSPAATQTFSAQPGDAPSAPGTSADGVDDAAPNGSGEREAVCTAPNAAEQACSSDNGGASSGDDASSSDDGTSAPPGEPSRGRDRANSGHGRGDAAGDDRDGSSGGAEGDGGGASGGNGTGGDGAEEPDDGAPPPPEPPEPPPPPEPPTPPEPPALPDLIVDGAYLAATIQQDVVDASADLCLFNEGCVTGDGLRRVVRFGTRSANVGNADVIVGQPVAGNPLWEFDACHEHFHFEGYARYDLVDAATGEVLPIGNKNGFCLQDLDVWNGSEQCSRYDCDYQGISVGCADVYTPDLDCQWIDITDVAPGNYELVVTVNTDGTIQELRTDNNSASVSLQILPETVLMLP